MNKKGMAVGTVVKLALAMIILIVLAFLIYKGVTSWTKNQTCEIRSNGRAACTTNCDTKNIFHVGECPKDHTCCLGAEDEITSTSSGEITFSLCAKHPPNSNDCGPVGEKEFIRNAKYEFIYSAKSAKETGVSNCFIKFGSDNLETFNCEKETKNWTMKSSFKNPISIILTAKNSKEEKETKTYTIKFN